MKVILQGELLLLLGDLCIITATMSYNFTELSQEIEKALNHVQKEISSIRTGKASTQMLDTVVVEAYGSKLQLVEMAQVSAPEPTMLVVSPYDKSQLAAIEKAIASAGLNLQPVVSGDIIRITIAPLTGEKRREMVKVLHQRIEDGVVMIRLVRQKYKKKVELTKEVDGVSEDDIAADLESLEEKIKEGLSALDDIKSVKEKELTTL